jgi:hypothetical protein
MRTRTGTVLLCVRTGPAIMHHACDGCVHTVRAWSTVHGARSTGWLHAAACCMLRAASQQRRPGSVAFLTAHPPPLRVLHMSVSVAAAPPPLAHPLVKQGGRKVDSFGMLASQLGHLGGSYDTLPKIEQILDDEADWDGGADPEEEASNLPTSGGGSITLGSSTVEREVTQALRELSSGNLQALDGDGGAAFDDEHPTTEGRLSGSMWAADDTRPSSRGSLTHIFSSSSSFGGGGAEAGHSTSRPGIAGGPPQPPRPLPIGPQRTAAGRPQMSGTNGSIPDAAIAQISQPLASPPPSQGGRETPPLPPDPGDAAMPTQAQQLHAQAAAMAHTGEYNGGGPLGVQLQAHHLASNSNDFPRPTVPHQGDQRPPSSAAPQWWHLQPAELPPLGQQHQFEYHHYQQQRRFRGPGPTRNNPRPGLPAHAGRGKVGHQKPPKTSTKTSATKRTGVNRAINRQKATGTGKTQAPPKSKKMAPRSSPMSSADRSSSSSSPAAAAAADSQSCDDDAGAINADPPQPMKRKRKRASSSCGSQRAASNHPSQQDAQSIKKKQRHTPQQQRPEQQSSTWQHAQRLAGQTDHDLLETDSVPVQVPADGLKVRAPDTR